MGKQGIKGSLLFILMVAAPFFVSLYYVNIITEILIFGIFAISLNILVGQTGLVSLGHAAFFGAGAYATGLTASHLSTNVFLALVIGMVIAFLLAILIGFVSTKAHGFYFLMLTLACSQMVYSIIYQWTDVTGGSNGLSGIPSPSLFGDFILSNQVFIYYFTLVVFAIVVIVIHRLLHSPLGYVFIGIKENEDRMKSIGYNTTFYKNISFLIAGTLGGLAGGLYVFFNGFVAPTDVYWTVSGSVLIMVLVGGAGTLWGPVIGAAFIVVLETIISSYTESWMMIIGTAFILFTIFAPAGIAGLFGKLSQGLFKAKPQPVKEEYIEKSIKPIKQQSKING
ncbi:branched-chain amino acid ABC transporter permease [Bacillus sp. JJ1521]|uniref:branched-chain amino acid ABC transporter permease n=1 Tax=Bacillus sp. JJ1521 TaxID=3122957 RepID=UPI002FFFD9DA